VVIRRSIGENYCGFVPFGEAGCAFCVGPEPEPAEFWEAVVCVWSLFWPVDRATVPRSLREPWTDGPKSWRLVVADVADPFGPDPLLP